MGRCSIVGVSANFSGDFQDTVTVSYQYEHDTVEMHPGVVFAAARASSPDPLPERRQAFSVTDAVVADKFPFKQRRDNLKWWDIDVVYSMPSDGSGLPGQQATNPLFRDPIVSISFIEKAVVIEKAKNLEALGPASAPAEFKRAANTLGGIVNGALQETEEPLMDSDWNGIITIRRNLGSLNDVLDVNFNYKRSCNSGTVLGIFPARTLKYQVTQAGEPQIEDGILFYEAITSIEILPSTDRFVASRGWKWLTDAPAPGESGTGALRLVTRESGFLDGKAPAEPISIGLDGKRSTTGDVFATFRYLNELDYNPLVT